MVHSTQIARVIASPAKAVWGEVRDFIESTRHMGIRKFVQSPNPSVTGTQVGCVRHVGYPSPTNPVIETLTHHSDDHMTFSLTVATHEIVPMVGYCGTVTVSSLGIEGCESLLFYQGRFEGIAEGSEVTPEAQLQMIEGSYKKFFKSVAETLTSTGRLANKVCLITGGASGLGAAISRSFAAEGASVIIADSDEKMGMKLQSKLRGSQFVPLDVTCASEVETVFQEVVSNHGRVDVVVNNAGIAGEWVPTAEHPISNWERVRSVNLDGTFYVLRASLQQMQSQTPTGGVILNMVSTTAFSAFPAIPAYTAAKAGLMGLTRSTAAEYGRHNIRVLALAPTTVLTPLVKQVAESMEQSSHKLPTPDRHHNPIPGMPSARDIASVAIFACSDEAKWVTGCVIPVDGGYLAGNAGYGPDTNRGARL